MSDPDSLSARMLAAAETIDELNARLQYGPQSAWAPRSLRDEAEHIAAEDRESAEREAQIEQLATWLYQHEWTDILLWARDLARKLVESGWTKA